MNLALLISFCAGLSLVLQHANAVPLVYFSFFPFGLLLLFHFFDAKRTVYALVVAGLLLLGCIVRFRGSSPFEVISLVGATVISFTALAGFRGRWERRLKTENGHWERAQAELADLKRKRDVRMESLRHLEKQVASLINLFEIARDFNECLDLKGTAQILYKKVLPEVPFERVTLVVLTPTEVGKKQEKIFLISPLGVEEKSGFPDGAPDWFEKVKQEKRPLTEGRLSVFPLMREGEVTAVFTVEGFEKEDLAKFEVLASQLALQVRKICLYEMVRELSILDGLTGVFVRRHFLERCEEELKRGLKHSFPLAVLMLDIDHFKRYNDDFGHLVGDMTLRAVAGLVRANVRNVDIVARYGGEEFVVVIPETRLPGALEAAERIRSAIARHAFRGFEEETKVTVSVGVSVFPEDVSEPTTGEYHPNLLFELLQRSDRALYWAKEEGRNRVIAYQTLRRS